MDQLTNALKQFQANTVIFSHLIQGFYWNTESVLMRQSRIIYEEMYTDTFNSLNEVSNWLRRLGSEAPYTIEEFSYHQTLGDVKPNTYCGLEMAQHLIPINNKMIEDIRVLAELSFIKKEHGLYNFISKRLEQHQTWAWQLNSILKLPPNPWKSLKD